MPGELLTDAQHAHVVKDQAVGQQVIVFDDLALLAPIKAYPQAGAIFELLRRARGLGAPSV